MVIAPPGLDSLLPTLPTNYARRAHHDPDDADVLLVLIFPPVSVPKLGAGYMLLPHRTRKSRAQDSLHAQSCWRYSRAHSVHQCSITSPSLAQ